jgi:lipopolysaccharide transport system ATP-binding protein
MSDMAIRVEDLSKRYRIGERLPYGTLRDVLSSSLSAPVRAFMSGRRQKSSRDGRRDQDEGYIWALKAVSFEVKHGEVVGVIGRNGSGKSTLLKILSRITEPTEGRAEVYGRVGSLLEVGTGFHPELTGRENVYLNGAVLGMKKADIDRLFDEIVEFSGVQRFIDSPVKRYSSGMQVRLAFSVAAHLEPEILLVDEVLAVGDLEFQKKSLDKMDEVSRKNRTVIFVSHNMSSVISLCQRAILLQDGRVIANGEPREVVSQYVASIGATGGEMVWPNPDSAPGNEVARLHRVRITQDGIKGATADVDITKSINVEISYWNLEDGTSLYVGFWLKGQLGSPVLNSFNKRMISLNEDPWWGRPLPKGLYKSVVTIPGNLLNEGRFTVSPIIGREPLLDTIAFEEDAVSFEVHNTSDMMQPSPGVPLFGVVRPRLSWRTELVESSLETRAGVEL